MGAVGCLGEIPFKASSEAVQTIKNFVWGGTAKYSTHDRHGAAPLTEFVSMKPDNINFDIELSVFLGVKPMDCISMLWDYIRSGKAVPLVLGNHAYGRYRWTVLDHKIKAKVFDGDGDILTAVVTVKLQEYLKE